MILGPALDFCFCFGCLVSSLMFIRVFPCLVRSGAQRAEVLFCMFRCGELPILFCVDCFRAANGLRACSRCGRDKGGHYNKEIHGAKGPRAGVGEIVGCTGAKARLRPQDQYSSQPERSKGSLTAGSDAAVSCSGKARWDQLRRARLNWPVRGSGKPERWQGARAKASVLATLTGKPVVRRRPQELVYIYVTQAGRRSLAVSRFPTPQVARPAEVAYEGGTSRGRTGSTAARWDSASSA